VTNPRGRTGYFTDFGDMTGTGRHVLRWEGMDASDNFFQFFYVLGEGMDDKVDMYLGGYKFSADCDTMIANSDHLTDAVFGFPDADDPNIPSHTYAGLIAVIYGSNKIPVPNRGGVKSKPDSTVNPFSITQSADGNTLLVHAWHGMFMHSTAILHDMLGRVIATAEESSPKIDWRIPLPPHAAGAYVLTIETDAQVFTYKMALLR